MEKQGKTEPKEEIRKGLGRERWGVKTYLRAGGLGRPCQGTSEVPPGSFYPASWCPLAVGTRAAHRGGLRPHVLR